MRVEGIDTSKSLNIIDWSLTGILSEVGRLIRIDLNILYELFKDYIRVIHLCQIIKIINPRRELDSFKLSPNDFRSVFICGFDVEFRRRLFFEGLFPYFLFFWCDSLRIQGVLLLKVHVLSFLLSIVVIFS